MNIYDEAIFVQDACNPSGVAHFLVKCMKHIRDVEGVMDTLAMCQHPLFILVVNKLDSLVRGTQGVCGSTEAYGKAYYACLHRSDKRPTSDRDRERWREASNTLPGRRPACPAV